MSVLVKEYHVEVNELLNSINDIARETRHVPVNIPSPLPEFEAEKWIVFNQLTEIPVEFKRTKVRGRGRGKGLVLLRKPSIEVEKLEDGTAENTFNANEIGGNSVDIPQEMVEAGFSIQK